MYRYEASQVKEIFGHYSIFAPACIFECAAFYSPTYTKMQVSNNPGYSALQKNTLQKLSSKKNSSAY